MPAKRLKILAVCGMGMGTVFIIKNNLESVLKELRIPADIEVSNVSSVAIGSGVDVIVASEEFKKILDDKPIPKVYLRNLIDKRELKDKLERLLKELNYLK